MKDHHVLDSDRDFLRYTATCILKLFIFHNCGKLWENGFWNPCSPVYAYKLSKISSKFSHCWVIELLPKIPDFTDKEL